jgi:apolipoprotein N-acyltransferase
MKSKIIFLLPILSGIFLIFAYPPYNFFGFIWIALIPLLIFVYDKKINSRWAFWGGLTTGFIFLGSVISWFFSAYPADWMGLEKSPVVFSLLILVWLVNSVCLASFIGLFSLALKKLKKGVWFDIIIISGLWIIFEYLRAWSFEILWLGKDSLLGPHWTLGFLGYGLADSKNILPLASIAGVYGLSFLVAFINGLIFFIFKKFLENRGKLNLFFFKNLAALILIFALLSLGGLAIKNNKEKKQPVQSLNVALLQTKFLSHFEYNSAIINSELDTELGLLDRAIKIPSVPNLIIFPEDTRFLASLAQYRPNFNLNELFKDKSITLIDSSRVEDAIQGNYFQLYYSNSRKGLATGQKKSFLMPGGEYMPYLAKAVISLIGQHDWLKRFEANREYSKGTELALGDYQEIKIGTLFCPEIFSPELYREITNLGAEVLVNISGHGVFRGSPSLLAQVRAMAKLRAAENNRYLIQAINYNLSSIIDNRGNVAIASRQIGNEVIKGEVLPISGKTFYDKYGNWLLLLSVFIVCAAFLKRKKAS